MIAGHIIPNNRVSIGRVSGKVREVDREALSFPQGLKPD
jgi:hypothetical protein